MVIGVIIHNYGHLNLNNKLELNKKKMVFFICLLMILQNIFILFVVVIINQIMNILLLNVKQKEIKDYIINLK